MDNIYAYSANCKYIICIARGLSVAFYSLEIWWHALYTGLYVDIIIESGASELTLELKMVLCTRTINFLKHV